MKKLYLLSFLLTTPPLLLAQGVLPPKSTTTATSESNQAILIGEMVPESLIVLGENGKERPLLSYRAPTELLVVVFFSEPCPSGPTRWPVIRRLQEHFEGWRVAFVAVTASAPETLSTTLKKERVPWPVVSDGQKKIAAALKITGTPELLIIDEFARLRYRGPVVPAQKALDTFIAQISPVEDPEPAMDSACPY